tara:strand:- start:23 stop:187 length:165 start_codon:yes stop_codon:yes gene_type:complete
MPRYIFEWEKVIVTEYIVEAKTESEALDKIYNEEYEDAKTKEYEDTKLVCKLDD